MRGPNVCSGDEFEKTRRRSARMRLLVDMIPARFYMPGDNDSQQLLKAAASLDPARAKSTSQIVVEAAIAARSAAGSPSAPSGSGAGAKKRKHLASHNFEKSSSDAGSRLELRKKLEQRIVELREERRQKQSEADKAKAAEIRAQRVAGGAVDGTQKKRAPADANADSRVETSRLIFERKAGDLPFSVGVGQRGAKAHRLHNALRQSLADEQKLREAEKVGRGEEMRKELAMQKALMRARGEKVHDNVSKIRKAQNMLDKKKVKAKEAWIARTADIKQQAEGRQESRNENLKKRSANKKKKKGGKSTDDDGRGFEGKRSGFVNKDK